MTRSLSDEDIEAICHRLLEFSGMTAEEHRDHHRAVQIWLEHENRRLEFREKVKQQIGGWMIISILSAIGYASWNGLLLVLQKGST